MQNRVPVVTGGREQVQAGLLLSYGGSNPGLMRAPASLIDKVINRARLADLPVQQPAKRELVVNPATVEAIGISIPPDLAAQVTDWVR